MINFDSISDVKSLCQLYNGKKIYVYILGGNRGDGVIYHGGRTLFKKYNIEYKEIYNLDAIDSPEKEALFVYGSGGFCSFFNSGVDLLINHMNKFKQVYVLPSTFDCSVQKVNDFITNLKDHVLIFCRELVSFHQVKTIIKNKQCVKLDNDLAFYGDYSMYTNNYCISNNESKLLIALRKDRESLKEWNIKYLSNDISDGPFDEYNYFINEINKYDTVITDRAHVSIVACLLNKQVFILPDGYHKVKSIYEYSLKDKYDVSFYLDDNDGFIYYDNNIRTYKKNSTITVNYNSIFNCKKLVIVS